jgi:hypothetical protein
MDVVIPTIRLDPFFLQGLLHMPIPPRLRLRYYVVVDQAAPSIPGELRGVLSRDCVTLLVNERSRGAAESRNRGFAAGDGEFVLFLDDDVVPGSSLLSEYLSAIAADATGSPGYVGVTRFPPPINGFTRGVLASDVLTFFDLAAQRPWMEWGVTANLCVRRSCVAGVPFDPTFPRGGGGEDIDFCLRMRDLAGRPFRAVPSAEVRHPWWNKGRRSYRRFFRWAYGDSRLPLLHPHHRYLNFPTLPELWILLFLAMPFLAWQGMAPEAGLFLVGSAAAEFLVDYMKLCSRNPRMSPLSSIEATVVRLSNDLGRLLSHVKQMRITGLLERFDYFGTGESIAYERMVSGAKFLCWVALACVVFA